MGVLVAILLGGIAAFYFTIGNKPLQLLIGLTMTVTYVIWGISHHMQSQSVHHKVVIEYMLIGAIAMVILLTLAI